MGKIDDAFKMPPPLPNLSLLTKTLTYSNISSSPGTISNAQRKLGPGGSNRGDETRGAIPLISGTSFLKDSVFRTSGVSSFTLSKNSTHPQESRGTV